MQSRKAFIPHSEGIYSLVYIRKRMKSYDIDVVDEYILRMLALLTTMVHVPVSDILCLNTKCLLRFPLKSVIRLCRNIILNRRCGCRSLILLTG